MRRLFLAGCILPFPFLHQTFRLGSVLSRGHSLGLGTQGLVGKTNKDRAVTGSGAGGALGAMRAQSRMQEGFLEEVLSGETRKQIN